MEESGTMKAFILANGDFPTNPRLIAQLNRAKYLVVCDGASKYLSRLLINPNLIIGDLDSITPRLKKKFAKQILPIKEQESNDLSKAFYHCIAQGFDDITIFGATGKREDHTLANIFLLTTYAKKAKKVCIKSDFGEFSIHATPCTIPSYKGQQISLFCLDSTMPLTSSNLKYPLNHLILEHLYQGSLNEALDRHFSLFAPKPTQIIIYKAYKP